MIKQKALTIREMRATPLFKLSVGAAQQLGITTGNWAKILCHKQKLAFDGGQIFDVGLLNKNDFGSCFSFHGYNFPVFRNIAKLVCLEWKDFKIPELTEYLLPTKNGVEVVPCSDCVKYLYAQKQAKAAKLLEKENVPT